jgi:predicted GH43/DUF377 family glycosyl hydrolase
MLFLKGIKAAVKEQQATLGVKLIYDLPEAKTEIPIIPDKENPIPLCSYTRLKYLDSTKLIDYGTNTYFFNACILPNNRLFYRVSKEPKGHQDRIATCMLTYSLDVIEGSNKYIKTHSNWKESATTYTLKSAVPFVFKDGEHVEDPRAIIFQGNYFVFYTDGLRIGVAKLDMECNTIYSHYLFTPNVLEFKHKDGREKNWIPFIHKNSLFLLYGTEPVIYFECSDENNKLEMKVVHQVPFSITWNYGYIRGGASPVEYDEDSLLWCFHSTIPSKLFVNNKGKPIYIFSVYVTRNTYPFAVIKQCKLPLLMGITAHASRTLSLQHDVVYPCGIVKFGEGWRISMGVNDHQIAFLDVTESDFLW